MNDRNAAGLFNVLVSAWQVIGEVRGHYKPFRPTVGRKGAKGPVRRVEPRGAREVEANGATRPGDV